MRTTRKKKKCEKCGRIRYIYARKMCQSCYMKGRGLKRTAFKPTAKTIEAAFGFSGEKELFLWIWKESKDKKCVISGEVLTKYLATTMFWSCFAHLLPKGLYGKFRLNPKNVWLVSPHIHSLIDNGTEEQRAKSGYDFSEFFKEKERLSNEYLKL